MNNYFLSWKPCGSPVPTILLLYISPKLIYYLINLTIMFHQLIPINNKCNQSLSFPKLGSHVYLSLLWQLRTSAGPTWLYKQLSSLFISIGIDIFDVMMSTCNIRHSSKSHKKKCCKKEITCIILITNQSLEFVTGNYEINNTLQWTWDKTADRQCRRGNSRWFLVDIFDNDLLIIIKDTWIKHLNIL